MFFPARPRAGIPCARWHRVRVLGLTMISLASDEEETGISVYPSKKKEQCGVGPITPEEIVAVGAVAKPDAADGIWCPTRDAELLHLSQGR